MSDLLVQLNAELAEIVAKARRSLVQIHNGRRGSGAGSIWHPDGLIVTNAHVVAGRARVEVTLSDRRQLPARLIAHDEMRDLAALTIDAHDLPTVEPGNAKQLQPGQWVMALGHPWGVPGAVTGGVVIGVGSQLPEMPPLRHDWIVVNLHMRPGHSGGPLIDGSGRLVGVNTMITGPDVGFAVPVHVIKAFLKEAFSL